MMKTRTQKLDQKPAEPKTVKTVEKRNRFEMVVVNILCLFVFLAFGYIALMAFFQTSVIDSTKYASEVILYTADIVPLNLLLHHECFSIFAIKQLKLQDYEKTITSFSIDSHIAAGAGRLQRHACRW